MGCTINSRERNGEALKKTITKIEEVKIHHSVFVQENENRFQEIYRLGPVIGSGSFGEVRKCFNRDNGTQRAVKIIRKEILEVRSNKMALEREINILKSLDHPNIIRIFEFFEDSYKVYIVMELCEGGELFDEILKRQNFNETHASHIMQQLLLSVAYIHAHNIVHRDIKPENILLEEKLSILNIKLIDFGSAVRVNQRGEELKGAVGTPYYIAPELFSPHYNELCDLWSCGVIMYILLSGYPPFDGRVNEEIIENVKRGAVEMIDDPWPIISVEAKDLIRCLLSPVESRISAEVALEHTWIKSRARESLPSEGVLKLVFNNLKGFHSTNKLRDAVHTFITNECLSAKDTSMLREVFKSIDKNGDGRLSREELFEEYSKVLGEVEAVEQVDKIMNEVDSDDNGFIDYTEFLKATLDEKTVLSAENLKTAFRLFDRDFNGAISASELKAILIGGEMGDDALWEGIVKEVDENGDGAIDLEEFQDIIMSKINL